jgi:hypothetical protein
MLYSLYIYEAQICEVPQRPDIEGMIVTSSKWACMGHSHTALCSRLCLRLTSMVTDIRSVAETSSSDRRESFNPFMDMQISRLLIGLVTCLACIGAIV